MHRPLLLLVLISSTLALDFEIQRLWNGDLIEAKDFVQIYINETIENDAVEINIKAPFYDDPAPDSKPGIILGKYGLKMPDRWRIL